MAKANPKGDDIMSRLGSNIAITALGLLLMLFGACAGSAPTRFYILNSLAGPGEGLQTASVQPHITVGIGPVEFPAYLDQRQIVTRVSENELHIAGFEEWAGTLKDNFTRVLVENLYALLRGDGIEVFPFRISSEIDYQVEVEVIRLDGSLGGTATLSARWTLFKRQDREMLLTKKSSFHEPAGSPGYEALVAAQSRTVEALSREIAEAIRSISR
jgi:uncharacterized lipoprotein YmbA